MGFHRGKGPAGPVHAVRRTGQPGPRFNYELFNCNNFNIRYWSWNYRGCWPIMIQTRIDKRQEREVISCILSFLVQKFKPASPCVMGAYASSHPFGWEWHVP